MLKCDELQEAVRNRMRLPHGKQNAYVTLPASRKAAIEFSTVALVATQLAQITHASNKRHDLFNISTEQQYEGA